MTRRGLVIIRHQTIDRISDDEILEALSEEDTRAPRELVTIEPRLFRIQDTHKVDFAELQEIQRSEYVAKLAVALRKMPGCRVLYFGFAHHALAFDLGHAVEDARPIEVFQRRKDCKAWPWLRRGCDAPEDFVRVEGLPDDVLSSCEDEVIVLVSCSTLVDEASAKEVVPSHAAVVHVRVTHPGLDVLESPEQLEAVSQAFRGAVARLCERRPRARRINLFAAVPVGLAFRMGTLMRTTLQPPIRMFINRPGASPVQRVALTVPPSDAPVRAENSSPIDELRRSLRTRQAVILAGAGVALASSGGAKSASWLGLLRDGLEYCRRHGVETGWVDTKLDQLEKFSGDADELIEVASAVTRKLDGPDGGTFRAWLRAALGSLSVTDERLIRALERLGSPLLTTNYDTLIETTTGRSSATWRDRHIAERVLRGDDEHVLHVHGVWDRSETVVLSGSSYEEIVRDNHAQAVLRAMFSLRTVVFVGGGAGLGDPNFGKLLEWAAGVFPSSEYAHYWMVAKNEEEKARTMLPKASRVRCLVYGERHDELAPFLERLAPER